MTPQVNKEEDSKNQVNTPYNPVEVQEVSDEDNWKITKCFLVNVW